MPPQDATPQAPKMSSGEFAAWLKKQDPELAQFPDDALVQGVLERRPDLRGRVAMPTARPAASSVEIPQPVTAGTTDTPGAAPTIRVAKRIPGVGTDRNDPLHRRVLFSNEEGTGKPVISRDNGASWQYMADPNAPPDPDAAQKWLRENATGFLTQLANFPRAMWQQSMFGQMFSPELRARRAKQLEEERQAIAQPGIGPGASYVFNRYVNPVVKQDQGTPDERVNWGASAANLLPFALAAAGARTGGERTPMFGGWSEGSTERAVPINAEEGARRITKALNPKGAEIPGYQERLGEHLDKVMNYIRSHKIQVRTEEDFAGAIKGAGDEIHDYFYRSILRPVGDTRLSIGGIPDYGGASEGGSATLNDLDSRLTKIRAELDPAYRKAAADNGAKLRTETDLRAEQGAIQERYYRALSKATEIPVEDFPDGRPGLRSMRQSFGALQDLANKTRLRAGEIQHAETARAQLPRTYIPFLRGHMGEPFFLNEWARKAVEMGRGTPQERGIRQTLSKVGTPPYQVPGAANLPETASTREAPVRSEGRPAGTIETPSAADREAHLQKLAERGQKVQAEKAAKAARVGGARLARGPAGAPEGPTFGETVDISPAEREAHLQKLAERGRQVREAREARARKIAAARAARRRPPEE